MSAKRQIDKIVKPTIKNIDVKDNVVICFVPRLNAVRKIYHTLDRLSIELIKLYTTSDFKTTQAKQIKEIKKDIEGPKKKKKQIWNWIFLGLNICIVAAIFINQLVSGGVKPLSEMLAEKPYFRFLALAIVLFALCLIFECLKFLFLIKKTTGKFDAKVAINVAVIGRYWDCITPFGSGGQPFQIYHLNKAGYTGDQATGIPLGKYMFWQVAFILIGLFVLISQFGVTSENNKIVMVMAWIGIVGNLLVFLFTILISMNKRIGSRLVVFGLKIATKLHLVKNYNKTLKKVITFINNYQKCIKSYAKSFKTVILQIVFAIGGILCHVSIAYAIYLMFNYVPGVELAYSWAEVITMAISCDLAVCFIPLPGGSGAAELSFAVLFAALFTDGTVFWALLLWRLLTFYAYIIVGLIFTFINFLQNKNVNNQTHVVITEEK